jgi:DNA-binding beta-propeller fold protein YncE
MLRAILPVLLAPALLGAAAASARAEACAGSGAGPCPYAAARIIGQRAEGVLRFPEAVAIGPQGTVYVADQLSYVVQRFSPAGAFEGEWGSYGGGRGQFGPIGGLATDAAGDVYVVDSSHDRIEKFDAVGDFIASWGASGSGIGQFRFFSSQNPTRPPGGGIAVAGNYVYVADSGNNRIERFNLQGGEPLAFGSKGAGPGQFSYPRGVAASAGEVVVADDDNQRIEKFDSSGNFESSVGSAGSGPAQFGFPYGVSLDAAGNVYVADDINHRIVKLGPQLDFVWAAGGFGSAPGRLAFPRALAASAGGETFVADTANGRIEVFGPDGMFLRSFGSPGRSLGAMSGPRGLAGDPAGGLLVSDSVANRVELFSPGSDAFAAVWNGVAAANGRFSAPAGIAVDPHGAVYLADAGDARVLRLWGDGTFLAELGGQTALGGTALHGAEQIAVNPLNGQLYVADTAGARVLVYGPEGVLAASLGEGGTPRLLTAPAAVAVNGAGDVLVADRGADRIVELRSDGTPLRQWGSRGNGDGQFLSPAGITVDAAGHVYVLDAGANRVQAFDGSGRFLEAWGLQGAGLGEFSQPRAIALDCTGSVYVADTNNNRVERFEGVAPASGCIPAADWPAPLDVAPVLHVSLTRRSGVLARRALALTVSCQRGCKVLATGTVAPRGVRGKRAAVELAPAFRQLPVALAGHVRLRLGARSLRRLRRELGRGRMLTARVAILAVGPTGRSTTLTLSFNVAR